MESYFKRIGRGSLTIFLCIVIAGLLGYFLRMYLTRTVSVADYGLFFAVFSLVSFLVSLISLGLYSSLTKHLSEFIAKKEIGKITDLKSKSAIGKITKSFEKESGNDLAIMTKSRSDLAICIIRFAKQITIFIISTCCNYLDCWIVCNLVKSISHCISIKFQQCHEISSNIWLALYFVSGLCVNANSAIEFPVSILI